MCLAGDHRAHGGYAEEAQGVTVQVHQAAQTAGHVSVLLGAYVHVEVIEALGDCKDLVILNRIVCFGLGSSFVYQP